MRRPVVAIVGKPNVGKSALFNRLLGKRVSIVEETPGVTRDRVTGETELAGRPVLLVDTGGLVPGEREAMASLVAQQVTKAIEESDVLIFVVDGRQEPTLPDFQIADLVRRSGKPSVFVANKADDPDTQMAEFWELGLGEPLPVSAIHGRNISSLIDAVAAVLPPPVSQEETQDAQQAVRLAIVGRPNVGKSSLVNALLGQERVIVSPIPGTTRDAVDTFFEWKGRPIILIDTAGLRKKSAIKEKLDYYAQVRAVAAIDRADVTVLVIDGKEGVTRQDLRIASYSDEKGKALVLVVSKWDLVAAQIDGDPATKRRREKVLQQDFTRFLRQEMHFVSYAPVLYVSSVMRWNVDEVLKKSLECYEQWQRRIATAQVNQWLEEAVSRHPPPAFGTKPLKIYYATQPQTAPPTFVLFANRPDDIPETYQRYLENSLRNRFRLWGTPVRLMFRQRE
ncbi:MAG: ribosome biogenesis GTPase Der [Armatimonadetes bacterium]|nr:ribosome biogenesis GTPase Der [Armatimonadota bacterium]MDW8121252.1 ribosome biogenesis GTPase Der [Armatimonadota bacterium]